MAFQSLPVCLTASASADEDFVVQYRAVGIDRDDAALPPPLAEPPVDKPDPAVQARIGATVYHLPNSTTRTLITYWPNTDE